MYLYKLGVPQVKSACLFLVACLRSARFPIFGLEPKGRLKVRKFSWPRRGVWELNLASLACIQVYGSPLYSSSTAAFTAG